MKSAIKVVTILDTSPGKTLSSLAIPADRILGRERLPRFYRDRLFQRRIQPDRDLGAVWNEEALTLIFDSDPATWSGSGLQSGGDWRPKRYLSASYTTVA
ncbi:MAG: hypothetical protein R3F11_16580 [Verrucomicrobiales bacterium]